VAKIKKILKQITPHKKTLQNEQKKSQDEDILQA